MDIPVDLHRPIHEAAQRRGCSARALILAFIEREVLLESGSKGRIQVPLVLGTGEPINPGHDEIYDVLFS